MPRAKRGFKRRRRVNKIKKQAEGFYIGTRTQFRRMAEAVCRSKKYAFRDRRVRKREFRSLWVTRLSAAAQEHDLSYSRLIAGLTRSNVQVNRKMLAEIAHLDPKGFGALIGEVRASVPAQ